MFVRQGDATGYKEVSTLISEVVSKVPDAQAMADRLQVRQLRQRGLRRLHRLDLRPELPAVRQPVLLLAGDKDPISPLPHAEMVRHGLPSRGESLLVHLRPLREGRRSRWVRVLRRRRLSGGRA